MNAISISAAPPSHFSWSEQAHMPSLDVGWKVDHRRIGSSELVVRVGKDHRQDILHIHCPEGASGDHKNGEGEIDSVAR